VTSGRQSAHRTAPSLATLAAVLVAALPSAAQEPSAREIAEGLPVAPIQWTPQAPEHHDVSGVRVLLLEDHDLPLVSVYARFRGGYGLFGREWYAAATALPALMRYGGTEDLPPDSVDDRLDYYAIQTSFGTGGGSISATLNTLTARLDVSMALWEDLLTRPRFDPHQVDLWRDREIESARRRADDPSSLAITEFNRLLYGDHPIGWEMAESDLRPERLSPDRLREIHRRIVCRDNLILGVTGDVTWDAVQPLIEHLVERIQPCSSTVPEAPVPDIRRAPGVYLIERDLEQAVIVMAHATSVHLEDDPRYFAATIGNSILGGGGFSSRIMARVRTEEGYAYSASSLWTTPTRYDGLVGATTSTRPETAVPAIEVILKAMDEVRASPPTDAELRTAVDRVVNGWVFNFESAGQIVSRTMSYIAQDLPEDWLQKYVDGIQRVTPEDVQEVFADNLRPADMMILVIGNPDRIGRDALARLGPVTVLASTELRDPIYRK
jgi:zinc protease